MDRPALETEEIEITPEMIEAGAHIIRCEVGGAELGGQFSAYELASSVFRAMASVQEKRAPIQYPAYIAQASRRTGRRPAVWASVTQRPKSNSAV